MFSWCKRASSRSAAFVGFVAFIIGAIVLVEPTRAEEVVGATAGELGVSAEGSASYGIQIAVPPGTTGVQARQVYLTITGWPDWAISQATG
jgi:hypothetical protein